MSAASQFREVRILGTPPTLPILPASCDHPGGRTREVARVPTRVREDDAVHARCEALAGERTGKGIGESIDDPTGRCFSERGAEDGGTRDRPARALNVEKPVVRREEVRAGASAGQDDWGCERDGPCARGNRVMATDGAKIDRARRHDVAALVGEQPGKTRIRELEARDEDARARTCNA